MATLDPHKLSHSPELGRSPFWERPSRALPGPEDLPGERCELASVSACLSNLAGPLPKPVCSRDLILWRPTSSAGRDGLRPRGLPKSPGAFL